MDLLVVKLACVAPLFHEVIDPMYEKAMLAQISVLKGEIIILIKFYCKSK